MFNVFNISNYFPGLFLFISPLMGSSHVMHTKFSVHHLAASNEGRKWCTLKLVCITWQPPMGAESDAH